MGYDEYDSLIQHIYVQASGVNWINSKTDTVRTGVCLRLDPGVFRVFPYENNTLIPFENAVRGLNPAVAVKVRTSAVQACLSRISAQEYSMDVDDNTCIQIFDTIQDLLQAEKDQRAAFIREEGALVIWEDNIENIITLCRQLEEKIIKLVWRLRRPLRGGDASTNSFSTNISSVPGSQLHDQVALDDHQVSVDGSFDSGPKRRWWSRESQLPLPDAEKGLKKERKLMSLDPL